MQRTVVQRILLKTFAIALLMHPAVYGQSLGEIARENRDKQDAEDPSATAKPRVITNKDLPKDPNASQAPSEAPAAANSKSVDPFSADRHSVDHSLADQRLAPQRSADQRLADQRLAQQIAADQWKKQILAQKK
jgi:hypothetical protein